eukprot:Em0002g931a
MVRQKMGHFAAHCRTRGLQLMQQKESDSSTDMDSAYLAVIGQESFWMVDIQLVATTLNSNWTRVQRNVPFALRDKVKEELRKMEVAGRFCFIKLPFGICSAPEHFQRVTSRILNRLEGVVCLIDDTLVFGHTKEEHDRSLTAILTRLETAGVTLNKDKCSFGQESLKFLGHVIDKEGIRPDPDKTAAIWDMPSHKTSQTSGELSQPLRDLLSCKRSWNWGPSQREAFSLVKMELSKPSVLAHYSPTARVKVTADASSHGLGAVLIELNKGEWRPVAFASRSMTETEFRYVQIEEALAVTWACEKFRDYILGRNFDIETDHKPLVPLLSSKQLDSLPPQIGSDLFELNGTTYMLVVDYFSRYIEVVQVTVTSSMGIIEKLKPMFSRQGIPQLMIIYRKNQEFKRQQEKQYNRCHQTRPQLKWKKGMKSYMVDTPAGQRRRNWSHLTIIPSPADELPTDSDDTESTATQEVLPESTAGPEQAKETIPLRSPCVTISVEPDIGESGHVDQNGLSKDLSAHRWSLFYCHVHHMYLSLVIFGRLTFQSWRRWMERKVGREAAQNETPGISLEPLGEPLATPTTAVITVLYRSCLKGVGRSQMNHHRGSKISSG